MEILLQRHLQDNSDPAKLIAALAAKIRPAKAEDADHAIHMIRALCHILGRQPELRMALRHALLDLLGTRKPVSLYDESGILPSTGFFSELHRRISHKLLPDAIDVSYLKDIFALIFIRQDDDVWISAVPDSCWLELIAALRFDEQEPDDRLPLPLQGILDAVRVLSYRISAIGLEPELIRNEPALEEFASPFLAQNEEIGAYLDQFARAWLNSELELQDEKHILVLLEQCSQVILKIRRTATRSGTSIHLTFLLQRLTQQLARLEALLAVLAELRQDKTGQSAQPLYVGLLKTLVRGECHKNNVRQHWSDSLELLALRVTENASRTGEHYIASTRTEYFTLLRSAMGAGMVIAFMAVLKLVVAGQHLPPLTEAIVFSLNYGLGFMLIHILHFTVATKQPAMTASTIAASIGESGGNQRDMENLAGIIAQTLRSQLAAILGNVLVVVPLAMLIAWSVVTTTGAPFVTPEKAHHLLADTDPIHSLAVLYAAIAGVCLFLSGLVAGHHDNLAVYNKIPQRLRQLRWLRRLLGDVRLELVAGYVENNLGALAGNFYFGCMLGGVTAIGVLFGLPVDIRHITFSSAYLGFSLVGLSFATAPQEVLLAVLGVILIGLTNLLVSFTLALSVAMKARKVTFAHWPLLLRSVGSRFRKQPREFLLPPASDQVEPSGPGEDSIR